MVTNNLQTQLQSFHPQKVMHLKDELDKKHPNLYNGSYIITEKFEGWDTSIMYDGDKFLPILSSRGRPIPALQWVTDILNKRNWDLHQPFILKAEAYIEETPFEILNGLLNRSKGNCECKDVVFKVHDIIYICLTPDMALTRLMQIDLMLDYINLPNILHPIPVLATTVYKNDLWTEIFQEVTERGGEGIVAKRSCSLYQQGKRNSDLLKMKLECTVDTLAIRLELGVGKKGYKSTTLVSKRANGTEIRTVLSNHEMLSQIVENPNYILGKVVQLKGMYEYEDGQLKEPVFQYIRGDKKPDEID